MMAPLMPGESAGAKAISGPGRVPAVMGSDPGEEEDEDLKEPESIPTMGERRLVPVKDVIGSTNAYELYVKPHKYGWGGGHGSSAAAVAATAGPRRAIKAAPAMRGKPAAPTRGVGRGTRYAPGPAKRKY